MRHTKLVLGVILFLAASADAQSQVRELPRQDIVFLIDNSFSMSSSDPLRMRGVAAGLVLDAAELASRVEAGLVFFADGVTPHELQDTDQLRKKLQADGLPPALGSTNMQAALEEGLDLLRGSSASTRRIVLITDGTPDDAADRSSGARQKETIKGVLVPRAVQEGIEIFALGLSSQVNQKFLQEVTAPTGGKTLVSADHSVLLERAKELLGDRDNVYTIGRTRLASELEYEFEFPPGVDRGRITVILDQPQLFAPDQIRFDLAGSMDQSYEVSDQASRSYVAAWTGFVSSAGDHVLRIELDKPGFTAHRGLQVFVEALSVLDVTVTLSPAQSTYTFGDEVRVDVAVSSGSGTLAPGDFQVTGEVRTGVGGTAVGFNGDKGQFQVPDVAGRHSVEVKVRTSGQLGIAEAEAAYTAAPPQAVVLESDRQSITFDAPLGAERSEVEASFKVYAVQPEGGVRRTVTISPQIIAPRGLNEPGLVQLRTSRGGRLGTDGARAYPLPPEGLDLTLRLALDSEKLFAVEDGRQSGEVVIHSAQAAAPLILEFEVDLRRPSLEIKGRREAIALWWDPGRARRLSLGRVESDVSLLSNLRIHVPRKLFGDSGGPELVELGLVAGDRSSEDERAEEADAIVLDEVALPAGAALPLSLVVSPSPNLAAETRGPQELPVTVRSHFGVEEEMRPVYWSVGEPWWSAPFLGPLSLHGRHLLTWTLVGPGLLFVVWRFAHRVRNLATFWRFRPGAWLPIGEGAIEIGGWSGGDASGALVLPNSGSALDDTKIGFVSRTEDGRQQVWDDSGQRLLVMERPVPAGRILRSGDSLSVPAVDEDDVTLWELDYDFEPGEEAGAVEVVANPLDFSLSRAIRGLILGLGLLAVVVWILGTETVADLVYRLPLGDWFYTRVLLPNLPA